MAYTAGGAGRGGGKHTTAYGRFSDARTGARPRTYFGVGWHLYRDSTKPKKVRRPPQLYQPATRATIVDSGGLLRLADARVSTDLAAVLLTGWEYGSPQIKASPGVAQKLRRRHSL